MRQSSNKETFVAGDNKEHVLILKSKRLWLLLFLLLLLVLLIPIKRDVPIILKTQNSLIPITLAEVDFTYPTHWPYSKNNPIALCDTSDTLGKVIFYNIKRPLWAELFCWHDTAVVSAQNDCFIGTYANNIDNYSKNGFTNVYLNPIRERLIFIVEDVEYHEPLPEVKVIAYIDSDTLNMTTDANGAVELIAPICSNIKILAEKDYFKSASTSGNVESYAIGDIKSRTLKLTPKYGSIRIVVRSLSDYEPLPDAKVTLFVNENSTSLSSFMTNVNGVAIAVAEFNR